LNPAVKARLAPTATTAAFKPEIVMAESKHPPLVLTTDLSLAFDQARGSHPDQSASGPR